MMSEGGGSLLACSVSNSGDPRRECSDDKRRDALPKPKKGPRGAMPHLDKCLRLE